MGISAGLAQAIIEKIGSALEEMGLKVTYKVVPSECFIATFHDSTLSREEAKEKGLLFKVVISGEEDENDKAEYPEDEALDWLWDIDPEEAETLFWGLTSSTDQTYWRVPLRWAAKKTQKALPTKIRNKLSQRKTTDISIRTILSEKFPALQKIHK